MKKFWNVLGVLSFIGILSFLVFSIYMMGFEQAKTKYFWQPSSLNPKTPINVTIGYGDGDYKKDYITQLEPANLHNWLVNEALENATSANLTWNYTPFKEYGTLTVNWEK